MAVKVKVVDRPQAPGQAAYFPALLKGLGVTLRHFLGNVSTRKYVETVEYPEQKIPYTPRMRGLHRLMRRDDGEVRCVACMMCPTVCPAHCITIVAEESPSGAIEKRPKIFEIDELRCVVCGLCVEACPCDAIRMDSGQHASPVTERGDAVLAKIDLLKRGTTSTATQGGRDPSWREEKQPARSIAKPQE